MTDNAHELMNGAKPLGWVLISWIINDINSALGTISFALGIAYTAYKFYKELKRKK